MFYFHRFEVHQARDYSMHVSFRASRDGGGGILPFLPLCHEILCKITSVSSCWNLCTRRLVVEVYEADGF
jgi:hypothetical protein